jgi:hypothetical protein
MKLRDCIMAAGALFAAGTPGSAQSVRESNRPAEVRVVLDEADAAIAILEKRSRGLALTDGDWRRLEESEGYVRLKRRQESFGAEDFDQRFRAFLSSDEALERLDGLREALVKWRSIDAGGASARAQAYLPSGSRIRAAIYPVIKRTPNSFVFELDSDPAIFMYVDPKRTPMQLENTLAHELHHVGSATCPDPDGLDSLAPDAQRVVSWLSAFGEGMAMLAAAGGPDVHPHASSPPEEWSIWERDIGEFAADLLRIQGFFREVLAGQGTIDEQRAKLFSFVNTEEVPQGGFYTVGWKMAALVERVHGREVVVRAVCDPRILLTTYNEVAAVFPRSDAEPLPLWGEDFLAEIVSGKSD